MVSFLLPLKFLLTTRCEQVPQSLVTAGGLSSQSVDAKVQKRWFVINPDTNRFATVWQIITNFALAFVALITPLQASPPAFLL